MSQPVPLASPECQVVPTMLAQPKMGQKHSWGDEGLCLCQLTPSLVLVSFCQFDISEGHLKRGKLN